MRILLSASVIESNHTVRLPDKFIIVQVGGGLLVFRLLRHFALAAAVTNPYARVAEAIVIQWEKRR